MCVPQILNQPCLPIWPRVRKETHTEMLDTTYPIFCCIFITNYARCVLLKNWVRARKLIWAIFQTSLGCHFSPKLGRYKQINAEYHFIWLKFCAFIYNYVRCVLLKNWVRAQETYLGNSGNYQPSKVFNCALYCDVDQVNLGSSSKEFLSWISK